MYVCLTIITITHNPKYLDQFLTVLLETFTTVLVFAELVKIFRIMCSFDQNIGLLPLVLIVLQK